MLKSRAGDRIPETRSLRPESRPRSCCLDKMAPPSQVTTFARTPAGRLVGRAREQHAIAGALDAARNGESQVVVVHGDPGVGKTALLDWAIEQARDFRVLRAVGVEGEMEFPFAALQQLCA